LPAPLKSIFHARREAELHRAREPKVSEAKWVGNMFLLPAPLKSIFHARREAELHRAREPKVSEAKWVVTCFCCPPLKSM